MFISHKGHTDTIQVYSVTVMTHVKALQAGHSSQGTSEPITPDLRSVTTCIHLQNFGPTSETLKHGPYSFGATVSGLLPVSGCS